MVGGLRFEVSNAESKYLMRHMIHRPVEPDGEYRFFIDYPDFRSGHLAILTNPSDVSSEE